jgi:hypothetical protein
MLGVILKKDFAIEQTPYKLKYSTVSTFHRTRLVLFLVALISGGIYRMHIGAITLNVKVTRGFLECGHNGFYLRTTQQKLAVCFKIILSSLQN